MTCAKFLETLKSLSEAFHITEDEVFTDDEKIVIIPKGDTKKPIKLVFGSEEENEAFQKYVNAIANVGEGYPMTSKEIRQCLDIAEEKASVYKIDFDS